MAKIEENCDHNIDPRVARFFLPKQGKNTPNSHKIYQMAIKYTK
jgi:hypothetical protein